MSVHRDHNLRFEAGKQQMIAVNEKDDDFLFIMMLFAAAVWYDSLRRRSRSTRSAILEPWTRLFQFGYSG
jgi:hypothetical protein